MSVVIFDTEEFKTLYPIFADMDDTILEQYFNVACLLCDNTDNSKVTDIAERKTLLYMLVCHIATLKNRGDTIVGTITAATEGKVNMSIAPLATQNWYNQTVCGAAFWQATAKYRVGMRYTKYISC